MRRETLMGDYAYETAHKIVLAIVRNLDDRNGLLDGVDLDIMEEMKDDLIDITALILRERGLDV